MTSDEFLSTYVVSHLLPLTESLIRTNWVVITGCPGSGKTSVCNGLRDLGYKVIPETSRLVIEKALGQGFNIEEINSNPRLLTTAILHKTVLEYKKNNPNEILILDTSTLDCLAFYKIANTTPNYKEIMLANQFIYLKVLNLEMIPHRHLKYDKARPQNENLRKRIDELLKNAYLENGYEITNIPLLPLAERISLIINLI